MSYVHTLVADGGEMCPEGRVPGFCFISAPGADLLYTEPATLYVRRLLSTIVFIILLIIKDVCLRNNGQNV